MPPLSVRAESPLTAAPVPVYIATCVAIPLFTVPDPPPPEPQSAPVPLSTHVELTCRHCDPVPVTGSVTVPPVTVRFPVTVTRTLNVFAAAVSRSFQLVLSPAFPI